MNEPFVFDLPSFYTKHMFLPSSRWGIAMWPLSEDILPRLGGFAIAPYYSHAGPALMLGEEAIPTALVNLGLVPLLVE
jgi:hypothetical protein